MCVSLEDNITDWSKCTWQPSNNNYQITVSSNDPRFERKHKYGILVVPHYKPEYEYTNFTYVLTVSDQDNFPSLASGITSSIIEPASYKRFKFPVSITATGVTILLTSMDTKAKLQVSTNYKDLNEVTSSNVINATGTHASLYFDQKQISQMCGDKRSEVSLTFT